MTLPPLTDWETTAAALHRSAQILEPIRTVLLGAMPNALHLALEVVPEGLSAGRLPDGSSVRLDMRAGTIVYHRVAGEAVRLPLTAHSQASLLTALLDALSTDILAEQLADADNKIDALLQTRNQGKDDPLADKAALTDDTPLTLNAATAAAYADVLYAVFTGIARYKARLRGAVTPANVWVHHFDLSTLWFADADMDEYKTHINMGFAPFSGNIPRPYIYAYGYPYQDIYDTPTLPTPATWETDDYTGARVDYDALRDIVADGDTASVVEGLCSAIHQKLLPILT
jgi:hypothetical protein